MELMQFLNNAFRQKKAIDVVGCNIIFWPEKVWRFAKSNVQRWNDKYFQLMKFKTWCQLMNLLQNILVKALNNAPAFCFVLLNAVHNFFFDSRVVGAFYF